MINRRTFLKYSALAVISVSTGYQLGRFFNKNYPDNFSVFCFLPDNLKIVKEILHSFKQKINSSFFLITYIDRDLQKFNPVFRSMLGNSSLFSTNSIVLKLNKISESVNSDILISSGNKSILNPYFEFDDTFSAIRNKIKGSNASFFLSLEFSSNGLFSYYFKPERKTAVIEIENKITDKIELKKNYKNVELNGSNGKLILRLSDGLIKVQQSTCRHKICEKMGHISQPGEIIACAPNKILVRIENV